MARRAALHARRGMLEYERAALVGMALDTSFLLEAAEQRARRGCMRVVTRGAFEHALAQAMVLVVFGFRELFFPSFISTGPMREKWERLPLWCARSTICWRGWSGTEYVYKILPYPVNLKQEGEKARSAPTSSVEPDVTAPLSWSLARHHAYRAGLPSRREHLMSLCRLSTQADSHSTKTSGAFGP